MMINLQQTKAVLSRAILVEPSDSYRRFNNDTDIYL
jgi:hypothetical protein